MSSYDRSSRNRSWMQRRYLPRSRLTACWSAFLVSGLSGVGSLGVGAARARRLPFLGELESDRSSSGTVSTCLIRKWLRAVLFAIRYTQAENLPSGGWYGAGGRPCRRSL